ncbi:MAG: hypothetical protein QOE38_729 [Thermoleophilaceae bacterium]|jgi:hypothetical protein|nr:hypothetical protein [Thermoleophilaceae bacterium]
MPKFRRPSPALVVATAALVVALAGVTYGAIPGPDGTVHGCYDNSRGVLRVIDSTATCDPKSETALNFSQTGPSGPSGPPGQTKLLNFTHPAAVRVPRAVAKPIGSFDLPEGKWAITLNGNVNIPGSAARSLNFTRAKKLRSAAAVDFFRARAFSWGPDVSCNMVVGDGSVKQTLGTSSLIGLLLPAVQKQSGGGGGAGKTQHVDLDLHLVQDVPAGGAHGQLNCVQGNFLPGFPSPSAQLNGISIQAVQVNDVGNLNFTLNG